MDTGNNARLTYNIIPINTSETVEIFGIFSNSGWLYLKSTLDRETKDYYELKVIATDNGSPAKSATTKVLINVLDANDNDPMFAKEFYEFRVEENLKRGTIIGTVSAEDADAGLNAAIRYSLIPSNSSFQINTLTGEYRFQYI